MLMGISWAHHFTGDMYPHAEAHRRYGSDDTARGALALLGLVASLPLLIPFSTARTAARRPYIVIPVLIAAVVAASTVWPWLWSWLAVYGAVLAAGAIVLLVWLRVSPGAQELLGAAWLPHMRGWWVYRRRWRRLMMAAYLDDGCGVTRYVPELRQVTSRGDVDHLLVRPLAGQTSAEWMARSSSLADALSRPWVRIEPGHRGTLWLAIPRHAHTDAGFALDTGVTSAVHIPVTDAHAPAPASALPSLDGGGDSAVITAVFSPSHSVTAGHTPGGVHEGRGFSDHDDAPAHAVGGAHRG